MPPCQDEVFCKDLSNYHWTIFISFPHSTKPTKCTIPIKPMTPTIPHPPASRVRDDRGYTSKGQDVGVKRFSIKSSEDV